MKTTDRVKQVLALAVVEATQMGHKHLGTQHLLLGLLCEGEGIGCAALAQLGFDIERLRNAVREQTLRLTAASPTEEQRGEHEVGFCWCGAHHEKEEVVR